MENRYEKKIADLKKEMQSKIQEKEEEMRKHEIFGWVLACIGAGCGIAAAYVTQELPGALAAASAAFTALSVTWGTIHRSKG